MLQDIEIRFNPETGEFEGVPTSEQEVSSPSPSLLQSDKTGNLVLPDTTDSKVPSRTFNPIIGEFEWADENMKKLNKLRKRLKSENIDKLESKERIMKYGLDEIGLEMKNRDGNPTISAKDLGKTGNSTTGTVSEKDKKVAASQLEDYKSSVSDEQWAKLAKYKKDRKSK